MELARQTNSCVPNLLATEINKTEFVLKDFKNSKTLQIFGIKSESRHYPKIYIQPDCPILNSNTNHLCSTVFSTVKVLFNQINSIKIYKK